MTRLLLSLCLAASAGVHAALAPAHLATGTLQGGGFLAAAALLATAAALVVLRPGAASALVAGTLLAALVLAWLATRATEPVDALGVATKTIETLGLLLAGGLVHRQPQARRRPFGALAAVAAVALAAGVVTPMAAHTHPPGAAHARH